MYILGISAYYHDSAACLLKDGDIAAAAQEERFSRKKHDANFPHEAIRFCFAQAGITADDLSYVAFYDKPFLKFERLLDTYLAYAPQGIRSFLKAMPLWLKKKLWLKDHIARSLDYSGPIVFPEHHLSHAASAFYPSPFKDAAIMTMDGVGEWTTTSFGVGDGNTIELWADVVFPHSLGLLYSAITYFLGFKVNSGEYKVMGLAPYGEARFVELMKQELVDIKDDGSFQLNMKYFNYPAGLSMTNRRLERLFGIRRRTPESELLQTHMDIARSLQVVTEEIILKAAAFVAEKTKKRNLVLAGGVALNCVANGKLIRERVFDDIWIQPAAGDAGGALGAAFALWHGYLGNKRTPQTPDAMHGAYLGPAFSHQDITGFLRKHQALYRVYDDDVLYEKVAALLAEGKVVGWFDGRMEFGPRALGARSIIGDARNPETQRTMNLKIKFRESFRPFAPSVLEEDVGEYFALERPSPYMLLVASVADKHLRTLSSEEEKHRGLKKLTAARSDIPAITHVDNSARIQSVNKETNPRYHALLSAFKEHTGCSVVVNTSFNVRGEPIVATPEDAYRCFMRTNMDYVVLGSCLLEKEAQPAFEDAGDWRDEFELD